MGKKHRKPKTKMKSYGGGEELPIVKDKQGLFKKPEFYLADQKYDNLGHGTFEGQYTGKLEGPSQRAIKGKGKKAKNVRVNSEGGDPIFLQDTSPMEQKYSSQSGMDSAVKRWKSPMKLTSKDDPNAELYEAKHGKGSATKSSAGTGLRNLGEKKYSRAGDTDKVLSKDGQAFVTDKSGKMQKLDAVRIPNEAPDKKISKVKAKTKEEIKQEMKQEKKANKEAYRKTDEFKEKDASRRSKVNQIGKALMDFAGLDTSNINIDSTKKEKKPSESVKDGEITIDDSHIKTPDRSKKDEEVIKVEGESSSIERRGDLKVMSAMMRKVKNPQKKY